MGDSNDFATGYALGSDNNNDGFGGSGGWIWIIVILALLWGRGGYGYGGGSGEGGAYAPMYINAGSSCNCATPADIQRGFDNQSVINKLNGLENGLCDGFYAQNTNLLNGFSGVQSTLCQGFSGINNAITQNGYETRLNVNAIGTQLQSCCCDVRADLAQNANATQVALMQGFNGVQTGQATIGNQISTAACSLGNQMVTGFNTVDRSIERSSCDAAYRDATNTTAIVQNAHNDTDRILAKLNDMEATRQAERMAALQLENQTLKFAASQAAQTESIVDRVRPCPIPAYQVCNPFTGTYGYSNGCCGCNN